jgi:RNA polymerase sigma-70 factor (ECF subfamily)
VVLTADGGGVVPAVRRPITGARKVAAFLSHAAGVPDLVVAPAWLNGAPGVRIDVAGSVTAVSLVVEDGRVTGIYAMRNPDKLGWLQRVAELRR